jgi:hypothetical protein
MAATGAITDQSAHNRSPFQEQLGQAGSLQNGGTGGPSIPDQGKIEDPARDR